MNTETTYDYSGVASTTPSPSPGIAASVRRAFRRTWKSMLRYHWERQTARELASLPSYVLRDIGLRPDDIHSVASDLAKERADAWARQAEGSSGFGG